VIRRGKSGHFCDKALEGVSHHAIVPNVNVMDDLEARIARLGDDEKRVFALICRSYLAAVMSDFEYRQTVVTMNVPVPQLGARTTAEFRAVGRIPLVEGWKAAFGTANPEPGREKEGEAEGDQTLPVLIDGQHATLTHPRVQAKQTQPPPRYNEGTLVDAMQNAWRFVKDEALSERLKEAKGIGTPATRAEIIKGLKRQNLLTADGKLVVPTPAGLQLFELLRAAAPALVDPGTTAIWEMRLDDVVVGKAKFRAVIDEIAGEAEATKESLRFDNLSHAMSFADAFFCGLPMLMHKFDSNRCTIKHPSGHQRRATTHERVEHNPAVRTCPANTLPRQPDGKGARMR
jgi:DNA topoisomerase III